MYRLFHVKQAASVQGLPDLLIAEGRGEAAVVGDALLGEAFRQTAVLKGLDQFPAQGVAAQNVGCLLYPFDAADE